MLNAKTGFESFLNVLKNMPFEKRQTLLKDHKDYGRLRILCIARKWIEFDGKTGAVTVINKTDEVIKLREVLERLNPGNFKWIEKGIDLRAPSKKKKIRTAS